MPLLEVILCTHNPRIDYLNWTLDGLRQQTLGKDLWRLIIVDSGSATSVVEKISKAQINLDQLDYAVVREELAGLTRARVRGIEESKAEIIVFADDDNVLASDYLEKLLTLVAGFKQVGCFGASIAPKFEQDPDQGILDYLPALAVREISRAVWSNHYDLRTAAYGAGLSVRRQVAEAYSHAVTNDPRRLKLDRCGTSLASCGDIDIAFTANDLGLGCGLFPELYLTHLIPASRLEPSYLKRISRGAGESAAVLTSIRRPEAINLAFFCQRLAVLVGLMLFRRVSGRRRKIAYTCGQIVGICKILRTRS